jgi:hypothetical protein
MLFKPGTPADASPPQPAIPPGVTLVCGQYLAKNRLTPDQRARLVIGYLEERVDFVDLCIKQLAQICRVDVNRVQRLRQKQRNANGNGGNGHHRQPTLADRIKAASAEELITTAREVGIETIWDNMISPIVSEDRAAR